MARFPGDMTGWRALITGASRGIGRAAAVAFAELGVDVGVVGRTRAGLEETRRAVEALGRECLVIEADLAADDGPDRIAEAALGHAPRWDVLVNNAGIVASQPLLETDLETFDAIHRVNARQALALSQRIVPQMIARGSGRVVNVTSIGAMIGTAGLGAYAASKAAMNQLTRTMAVEWGPGGVRVNAICPTIILTELGRSVWDDPVRAEDRRRRLARIPAGRFGEPEDAANLIVFLGSPAAEFLSGLTIPLDGGLSVTG